MGIKEWLVRVRLDTSQLQLTNSGLSRDKIKEYRDRIRNGEELEPPFVRMVPGEGYFVNDGNHRVAAAKKEKKKHMDVDVYNLDNP